MGKTFERICSKKRKQILNIDFAFSLGIGYLDVMWLLAG